MKTTIPNHIRKLSYGLVPDLSTSIEGAFQIPKKYPNGSTIKINVIIDDGATTGWEHASVSIEGMKRLPNWEEMCLVKETFWDAEECVIQFHPPRSVYVDNGPILHLWKQVGKEYETPPTILVGAKY
jgi:hypothetical protein